MARLGRSQPFPPKINRLNLLSIRATGSIAVTEGADSLVATGQVQIHGSVAVTEGADVLVASGTVAQPSRTGSIAVIEGADVGAGQGSAGGTDTHDLPILSRAAAKRLRKQALDLEKERERVWDEQVSERDKIARIAHEAANAIRKPAELPPQPMAPVANDDEEDELLEMILLNS